MDAFDVALPLVLQYEGGYSNHPSDAGRATNKGVTQGVYNVYRKGINEVTQSVKLITEEEVADIYYNKYYLASKANKMPEAVAIVHFDTAVNFGVGGASKLLQRTLGVAVDGIIGPNTLNAIQQMNEYELAKAYCDTRLVRRDERVQEEPSQSDFLKGWKNRDNKLKKFIIDLEKNNNV